MKTEHSHLGRKSEVSYDLPTAARLTRIPEAKIRYWLAPGRQRFLSTNIDRKRGTSRISFLDMLQLRIINRLRTEKNYSLAILERAIERAASLDGEPYPFLNRTLHTAIRKNLRVEMTISPLKIKGASRVAKRRIILEDAATGQLELDNVNVLATDETIGPILKEVAQTLSDVDFSIRDRPIWNLSKWCNLDEEIVIDPDVAGGYPVLRRLNLPTATIVALAGAFSEEELREGYDITPAELAASRILERRLKEPLAPQRQGRDSA